MVCFIIVVQREHAWELSGGLVKTNCWAPSSEPLIAPTGWGLGLCGLTSSQGDASADPLDVIAIVRTAGLPE